MQQSLPRLYDRARNVSGIFAGLSRRTSNKPLPFPPRAAADLSFSQGPSFTYTWGGLRMSAWRAARLPSQAHPPSPPPHSAACTPPQTAGPTARSPPRSPPHPHSHPSADPAPPLPRHRVDATHLQQRQPRRLITPRSHPPDHPHSHPPRQNTSARQGGVAGEPRFPGARHIQALTPPPEPLVDSQAPDCVSEGGRADESVDGTDLPTSPSQSPCHTVTDHRRARGRSRPRLTPASNRPWLLAAIERPEKLLPCPLTAPTQ